MSTNMLKECDLMTIEDAVAKVKEYLSQASREVQAQAVQTIKKLKADGRSPLWIYYAMTNNKVSDIENHGFGSVYSDKVIPRIDAKVETHVITHSADPWDYLDHLMINGCL